MTQKTQIFANQLFVIAGLTRRSALPRIFLFLGNAETSSA